MNLTWPGGGPARLLSAIFWRTVLLPLSATGAVSQVIARGGTFVPTGWTSDEISHQLVVNWRLLGMHVNYKEITPGFAPQGGGRGGGLFCFFLGHHSS